MGSQHWIGGAQCILQKFMRGKVRRHDPKAAFYIFPYDARDFNREIAAQIGQHKSAGIFQAGKGNLDRSLKEQAYSASIPFPSGPRCADVLWSRE